MKYKLAILILFVSFSAFSQIMEWRPNILLTKADFQGPVPEDTINHAGTAYNIGYEVVSTSIWTGRIKMRTYAIFDKSKSWMNQNFYTDDLLNHEQKHFDIAQIYACKLQKLINKEIRIPQDFDAKMMTLNKTIADECELFHKKYDSKTNHGTIPEIQKQYNQIIGQQIEQNCSK